ncbi:gluconate 2-dehydrogenase subunit 3 family protein [uncultured Draconibacterium sp.]|uniref:gluconate 2-dehydrogenase subunit 3 family protein n=1 Tax=uncultured Draconibacterium sp. TaxID=1573823 RepID=UPI0029C77B33|nr:gluconate 2-dehydrogenase subunit 3 family protein [uncultured Draconibacterium sp.]
MATINRRDFIKTASIAYGSILFFPSCLTSPGAYRFFTDEEANCIIAFCEQIIPADESPGATSAGIIHYIDKQLSGVFHYDQTSYRNGIKNLQNYCTKKFGKKFEAIEFGQQTNILSSMEAGELTTEDWPDGNASSFFNLILSHTMQGFYGSPIHGGNKNYMSFEMLRIDYPLVIGQNRYRS